MSFRVSSFIEYKFNIFLIVYLAFFQLSFLLFLLVENCFSNFSQILSFFMSLEASFL